MTEPRVEQPRYGSTLTPGQAPAPALREDIGINRQLGGTGAGGNSVRRGRLERIGGGGGPVVMTTTGRQPPVMMMTRMRMRTQAPMVVNEMRQQGLPVVMMKKGGMRRQGGPMLMMRRKNKGGPVVRTLVKLPKMTRGEPVPARAMGEDRKAAKGKKVREAMGGIRKGLVQSWMTGERAYMLWLCIVK